MPTRTSVSAEEAPTGKSIVEELQDTIDSVSALSPEPPPFNWIVELSKSVIDAVVPAPAVPVEPNIAQSNHSK